MKNFFSAQRGMTLIEVMIAGSLGLVITYFIMQVMISSNKSAATSDGLAEAQETGRFVMSWLQTEVRRGGYTPVLDESSSILPFADLCTPGATEFPPDANADCTFETTSNTAGDRIAVRWLYNSDSTVTRDTQDCTGAAIAGVASETELVDVYWVETDMGAVGDNYDDALRCVTYSQNTHQVIAPAQTIASGVVGLHIIYGEFTEDATGTVTSIKYVNADKVTDWSMVKAARIAVLTRSFSDVALDSAKRNYILLDSDPYKFNDQVSRYVQVSTVALTSLSPQQ